MHSLISLYLLATTLLSLLIITQPQCPLTFILPNIIKDVITMTYSNGNEQSSSYMYFPSMFSSSPKIAYSISQLDIAINAAVKYYLDIQPDTMQYIFYFNAPNQTWSKVAVNIWITSRNDIIVSTDTIKNIAPAQNINKTIDLTTFSNSTITASARHIIFITGISLTLVNGNLSVNVTSGAINRSAATIQVSTGSTTFLQNITLTSIIIDTTTSQFLSYVGTITYRSFSSQYFNLYSNFLPIYYYLIGINSFSITPQNNKYFGYSMDLTNSTLLTLNTPQNTLKYDSIGFSYITIGMQTATICSNCNNAYITHTGCLDICPANTYPFNYSTGGKACLQCPSIVGLKLNDLGNACSCLPGYQLLTTYQCIAMSTIPTNCKGQNVIQNGTACICSPGTYNISGLCQTCPINTVFNGTQCIQSLNCPANATYSITTKNCICNQNFMNITGSCMPCQNNQIYNSQLLTCTCMMPNQVVGASGSCICQTGYNNVSNFCIQCPAGTQYINGSCSVTSCPQNQILSNSQCICDAFSVKKGNACQKCGSGTFPDKITNLCNNCIDNCANCNNSRTCQVCNLNYIFDFSSLNCIQIAGNTSSTVSITSGFPVITPTAFVIDFSINSPATLSTKSVQQMARMINISYPSTQPKPYRTIYKQSPSLNRIKITFDYRCLLPFSSFVVSFGFLQAAIALNSTINATFSTASGKFNLNIPE